MKHRTGLLSQYGGLRREIYILFFGRIVTNMGSMVWPMLTMILSQKLGFSAGRISILFVASTVIMMPVNLLGGKLADKCNKKNVIVVCDTVSIFCYIACGLLPLTFFSVILMLCAAVCQSMEHPSYSALTADLTATADRERAFSLLYLGGNLGLVLSPTIAGMLFKDYLWLSFLISAAAIACSTVLIFFRIRDIRPEKDESAQSVYQTARSGESLWRILRENRILLIYLVITALSWSAYGQYSYLMPLDMGRVHGEDGALLYGTVSSLNCIVVVLFTPLITRLFAKVTEPGKLLIGLGLLSAGYLLFLLLLGHIPVYYVAMLLFTWGEIFMTLVEGPYLSRRIPASHRGRINGLSSVLAAVISSVSDLSAGQLYDRVSPAGAWSLVLGMLAAAVLLTFSLRITDRKTYPALYEAKEDAPPQAETE